MKRMLIGSFLFRQGMGLSMALGIVLWSPALIQAQTVPPNAPEPVRQGYVLLQRGWVDDAIATFRQALQRYPQSLEAQLGLAIAYQRAGQDTNAWEAYQRVLAQNPNQQEALAAVGLLGSYRPEWQEPGINALTQLLTLNPEDQSIRAQRALLLGYQGRFAESLTDYEQVLARNPASDSMLGAAQIYTYSGDYRQGLRWFEQYQAAGETIPDPAVSAYALALQETGQPQEAVRVLESRLRSLTTLDATAMQLRSALAIAYQANQQLDDAMAVLRPLQGNEEARLPLARAWTTIGRKTQDLDLYEAGVTLYRQVLAQHSNPSVGFLTEVADVLSESSTAQAEALQLYRQLMVLQPDNQSLQVKYRVLDYQLGQVTDLDVSQQIQALLTPLPQNPVEQRAIALALVRFDSPDPALLPIYQQLPIEDVPFLEFRMAQMEVEQGNLDAARQRLARYAATQVGGWDGASELLLADIERQGGELGASAQRYEAILTRETNPTIVSSALRGLAGLRVAQGQPEAALALYDQLLATDPEDWNTRLGQSSLAYQLGYLSQVEAEGVLNQWLDAHALTNPPSELITLVGVLPPDPQRESLYEALLTVEPDHLGVYRRWLQVVAVRDPDAAQNQVDEWIANRPNDVNAYWLQGELAQLRGDLALASQSYSAILEQQPDNPDAMASLAGVYFQQRQFTQSARLYEQALALSPNTLDIQRALAELNAAQDYPLTALDQFLQIQEAQTSGDRSDSDSDLDQRIQRLEVDVLRRRGFQPYWERY